MFRFKIPANVLAPALLLVAVGAWHPISTDSRATAQEPKQSKIKELLRERLALLREIASPATKAYQSGEIPIENLLQASHAVLMAELDLCESRAAKIAVLEKIVGLAREVEKTAETLAKAQEAPASAPLKAKVARLEAEIALERAQEE